MFFVESFLNIFRSEPKSDLELEYERRQRIMNHAIETLERTKKIYCDDKIYITRKYKKITVNEFNNSIWYY
jgi:hypothetical protein